MMEDKELATEIIRRLNGLLADDPEVGVALGKLIKARVPIAEVLRDHPTIQVMGDVNPIEVGFLGMLNGIVGAIPSGKRRGGWGYVMAIVEEDGRVSRWEDTEDHVA